MPTPASIVELLRDRRLTAAFAESCTGGLITKLITDVPGASAVLTGGVCAYKNSVKRDVLGVPERYLVKYGAVSRPVALAMARGVRRLTESDLGVGVTGIAGPASDDTAKPVGLVHIALALPGGRYAARELRLSGGRDAIRAAAADAVLGFIAEFAENL